MNTKNIISRFFIANFVMVSLLPTLASAISLEEAKNKGLVGEQVSGYLDAVSPSGEVNQLVQEINGKRREKYKQIADQNHTALSAVETLAGKKAVESSPPGSYIKSANGQWVRK